MTNEELLARTALASWKQVIDRLDQGIVPLTDAEMQLQVAPGKNRLYYLVGHLAAVHDRMFPLLGLGDRLHPELDEAFLTNPDRKSPDKVSPADIKQAWSEVNAKLTAALEALAPEDWFKKHNSVSDEDFAKDPLRNKLSVLMSRTNHASFHGGQMRLVK